MIPYPFNVFNVDFNIEFPLSEYPYQSRVEMFEITRTNPKNYVMVGFRPGFPLQASELNEMQEITALNQTLTTSMINLWGSNNLGTPSTAVPIIHGPGWAGTTPLWPERIDLSDSTPDEGPTTSMFEHTLSGSTVTVTAKKGWYLVHVRSSGLKHWIYLNEDIVSDPIETTTSDKYVGFQVYYTNINVAEDPTLYDNSSTSIPIGTPAGANRIKLNINMDEGIKVTTNYYEPLTTVTVGDLTVTQSFSPIAKINSTFTGQPVRYMNNRNVPVGS